MIYCNPQFIHFGDTKGHQGTLLTFCFIDLSYSYFAQFVVKEFIIQNLYRVTSYLFVILSIYLHNKEQQLFVAFSDTFFVFIAPNLVYLHKLGINKAIFLLPVMLISGVIKAQSKAQKMGENLQDLASARRG